MIYAAARLRGAQCTPRIGPGWCYGRCKSGTAALLFLFAFPCAAQITVTSATYGGGGINGSGSGACINGYAAHGNVTAQLAIACTGKMACAYTVSTANLGDPVAWCYKDYVAEWTCAGSPAVRTATALPGLPKDAGSVPGSVATLACSAPTPGGTSSYNTVTFSCAAPMAACAPLVLRLVQGTGKLTVDLAPGP